MKTKRFGTGTRSPNKPREMIVYFETDHNQREAIMLHKTADKTTD